MLRCPVCHEDLRPENKRFICNNQHAYDRAKDGSLFLNKQHSHKARGDNKLQIQARHDFHALDHYKLIKDTLIQVLSEHRFSSLLDCGCGEGYYTNELKDAFPRVDIYALDLSKEAIHLASKQHKDIQYIIGTNNDLPFTDRSFGCITSIFSPFYLDEIYRALLPSGIFVVVQPGSHHLFELKEKLYENVLLNKDKQVEDARFLRIDKHRIQQRVHLDKKTKNQLLKMTPYFYTSSKDAIEKFLELDELCVTISALISVYRRQP